MLNSRRCKILKHAQFTEMQRDFKSRGNETNENPETFSGIWILTRRNKNNIHQFINIASLFIDHIIPCCSSNFPRALNFTCFGNHFGFVVMFTRMASVRLSFPCPLILSKYWYFVMYACFFNSIKHFMVIDFIVY